MAVYRLRIWFDIDSLELDFMRAALTAEDMPPTVSINGVAGKLHSNEMQKNGNRLLTYSFPPTAISGKNSDTIAVTAAGKAPVNVHRVEVGVHP